MHTAQNNDMAAARVAVANRITILARQLGVDRAALAIARDGGPDLTIAGLCRAYFEQQLHGYGCDAAGVEHWRGLPMTPCRFNPTARAILAAYPTHN